MTLVSAELMKREEAQTPAPVPIHAGNMPEPQYMQGFDGASVQPFDKTIADKLLAPFEPGDVEVKPDGIVFLPGEWYRRRLTEAFGPGGWALLPRGPVRTRSAGGGGELVVYHGALYCLGRYVGEAYGECTYWPNNRGMTYGDAVEGALTNCVDRCCKRLGMASELWSKPWRDEWLKKNATQVDGKWKKRTPEAPKPKHTTTKAPPPPSPAAATAPAAAPAPAAKTSTGAKQTSPAAPGTATGDTGEAAPDKDVNALRTMMLDTLKWPKDRARNWLMKYFGLDSPSALTKQQVRTAFDLLFASEQGEENYRAAIATAQEKGWVLK